MHRLLQLSGDAFLHRVARQTVRRVAGGDSLEVRLLDAADIIDACSSEVNRLMLPGEAWDLMRPDWQSYTNETLAFRILARGSGAAQLLLNMRDTYPVKIFWLLRFPEFLELILADPPCLWDAFTKAHMEQFRDELLGKNSIAVLLAAAVLLKSRHSHSGMQARGLSPIEAGDVNSMPRS